MQPNINNILFTSDLSQNSRHAFQYASIMAERFCATLHFLYVMEDVPMSARAFVDAEKIQRIREQTKNHAENQLIGKRNDIRMLESELGRFCKETLSGNGHAVVQAQVRVVEGNIIDSIISVSDELDCEMIIMGGGGGGGLHPAGTGYPGNAWQCCQRGFKAVGQAGSDRTCRQVGPKIRPGVL